MRDDRLPHALVAGDVVRGRVDHQLVEHGDLLTGERVDHLDALDLVAEQLDAHRRLLVGRVHLDGVAPHAELAAHEVHVVALVAHVDELAQHAALVDLGAHLEVEHVVAVLLGRAEAVDARHRGHHDDVAAGEQGRGGGVAQPVDLVVHRRVLLDVGVATRRCRPRVGSSRSRRRSTPRGCAGRTRGTRWRAGRPATCSGPARGWAAAPARWSSRWWRSCPTR